MSLATLLNRQRRRERVVAFLDPLKFFSMTPVNRTPCNAYPDTIVKYCLVKYICVTMCPQFEDWHWGFLCWGSVWTTNAAPPTPQSHKSREREIGRERRGRERVSADGVEEEGWRRIYRKYNLLQRGKKRFYIHLYTLYNYIHSNLHWAGITVTAGSELPANWNNLLVDFI